VIFYPSPTPLRGILIDHKLPANTGNRLVGQPLKQALNERLHQRSKNLWLPGWPVSVANPGIVMDGKGQFWLSEHESAILLTYPDRSTLIPLLGIGITQATVTWDGWRGDLLQADTAYGFWSAVP